MPRTIDPIINSRPSARAAAEKIVFGGPLADDEYGNLIGDISNDAVITVNFFVVLSNRRFPIEIRAKSSQFSSTVVRLDKDRFEYSDCVVINKNAGIGRQIFKLVADTAKRLNFPNIEAEGRKYVSIKNPNLNCFGHYVYVKYGFDADIPANTPARPAAIAHHTRLLDLTADPWGLSWWQVNGVTVPKMYFTLANNSPSWQRFLGGMPAPVQGPAQLAAVAAPAPAQPVAAGNPNAAP